VLEKRGNKGAGSAFGGQKKKGVNGNFQELCRKTALTQGELALERLWDDQSEKKETSLKKTSGAVEKASKKKGNAESSFRGCT